MRRFSLLVIVVLAGAAAFIIALNQSEAPSDAGGPAEFAEVEWVIDGDTVDLIIQNEHERVRLIGIDAPESVSRDTPEQCYGAEASAALKGLLPAGTTLKIVRDNEARDRFGRLLLYLYRADDDLFVNEWLVANGYADTLFFEPNTAFRSSFTDLRNVARDRPLGLWAHCEGPDQPVS